MRALAIVLCGLVLSTATARAQVVNGDFENGGTGWSQFGPFPSSFPATGGNPAGYGSILQIAGNSGVGTINQTFDCGPGPGECQVTFDYRLSTLSGPGIGNLVVSVDTDSNVLFSTSVADGQWRSQTITFPCGTHTVQFQLVVHVEVFQQLEACVDNVQSVCIPTIPVEDTTWGRLKASRR